MIKKIFFQHFTLFVFIASLVISLFVTWHWFSGNKIMYFWDSYLPFDPKISFNQLFYFWQERIFPGAPTPGLSWFIYWGLVFLPGIFGFSLSTGQSLVYLLLLSLSILNFYLLTFFLLKKIFRESSENLLKVISFVAGLIYTFNIFTFFNFYFMFNPGAFLLTFLPLNFLSIFKIYPLTKEATRKYKFWLFLFFVSLLAITPAFGVYVFFLQYLVWLGFYLFIYWFKNRYGLIDKKTLELVVFCLLIIFLNLWWFVPAFINIKDAYSGASSFGTTSWFDQGFKDVELLNLVRGFGSALMANNEFSWSWLYKNQLFTFPLFLFPLLFLVGIKALGEKIARDLLLFLLGLTLISLFIMKFSNPPLAWILGLAFHLIPFFGGFRDSVQKAGIFFELGYIIFIAIGIIFVLEFLKDKGKRLLFFCFFIFFFLSLVVLSGPYFLFMNDNIRTQNFSFQGKNYSIKEKTAVPPEYISLRNFFEDKCKGETVLEIPRSGFVTNAVWEKYGLSYAGQDILPSLISCNFLTTASFDSKSETFIQVPYLFLQKGDIKSFKQYLSQGGIKYILVRKDFVPQNLVTWTYVDPGVAEKQLEKDNDFVKIYKNDLVSVFEYKGVNGKQYGFGLTKNVLNLFSPIQNSQDYSQISKILDNSSAVFLDNKNSQNLFKDKANLDVISANCIGCVKISPGSTVENSGKSLFQDFKDFIKNIIGKPAPKSEEVKISLDILSADDVFKKIIGSVEEENSNKLKNYISINQNQWKDINKELLDYKGDRFSRNTKYIEASNFLTIEKNTMLNDLISQSFKKNEFLNKGDNMGIVQNFILFEGQLLANFQKNITETNLNTDDYKARLDVPRDGNYICQNSQVNNAASIKTVSVDGMKFNADQYSGKQEVNLKAGSYLLNINYDLKSVFQSDTENFKTGKFVPIGIGFLNEGKYSLSFNIPSGLEGRLLLAVAEGELSAEKLKALAETPKSTTDVRTADIIDLDYDRSNNFHRVFTIDTPEQGNYYLYYYFLDPNLQEVQIKNLKVDSYIDDSYFRFVCITGTNKPDGIKISSVDKNSPTYYSLNIPKNYKGFLTFNQTYDKNWIAYYQDTGKQLVHIQNGYSNAWYVDGTNNKSKIIVEYTTQREIEEAGVLSIIGFIGLFLIYLKIKNEGH